MPANIKISDVVLEYPITEGASKFGQASLAAGLVGGIFKKSGKQTSVRALDTLNLDLNPGDRIGLVGHNGAGKTTLLRVLAGVVYPTLGNVHVTGRTVPLIDKGLGINEMLTAHENIELPMRLLGATTKEINAAKPEILKFTDLGHFAELPVRTYSAGMKARLAFAICTSINADILLLDEWIGVGDLAFVEKASQRIEKYVNESKILVLASHSLDLVVKICNRALWLENGKIIQDGDPEEVSRAYWEDARKKQLGALGL